ncbi:MAG: hypothetical protein DME21_05925 [Verrucomicrobia bacterium]|nr:MAG: hypothetical protein DME21_05925 [Verrucomicrobiota bacterium]
MKRGRVIVLCVAAAIVILVVGIYALRPREPSYQGKSLSDWVDLLYSTNHTQAMNSIGAIGPKAIPFLLEKARHEDPAVQRLYRAIWPKLPAFLRQRLPTPKPVDPNFPGKIGNALMAVGQQELPRLIAALEDRDPHVRCVAVLGIQYMGAKADAAVPELCKLLSDPDDWVRGSALVALGLMGSKAKPAVSAFIATLRFGTNGHLVGIRGTAAWALGEVGPDAQMAVPWLRQSLSDTNAPMRLSAAIALWRISQDTNVVSVVIEQFDRNPQNREILRALGEMGPLAKSAVPTLLKILGPPDPPWPPYVQPLAREALKKIDPEAAANAGVK